MPLIWVVLHCILPIYGKYHCIFLEKKLVMPLVMHWEIIENECLYIYCDVNWQFVYVANWLIYTTVLFAPV